MIGVVAGTGPHGLPLTDRLLYFASGAAYTDWAVLAARHRNGGG